MNDITLDEAFAMITDEAKAKLEKHVSPATEIDVTQKMNNDIIMNALCKAVSDDVIHQSSLNSKIVKLLNSSTNTVSPTKVGEILTAVRQKQPKMTCVITLYTGDMSKVINEWAFVGPKVSFNKVFEFIIKYFEITPLLVRTKMVEKLKVTIVNNIAQLVAKYMSLETDEERMTLTISITTITRLANMADSILLCEFKDIG